MSRIATCRGCGERFETPSDTERVPHRGPCCSRNYTARYRAEILALRSEVAELRAGGALTRSEQVRLALAGDLLGAYAKSGRGEPGRQALVTCVRAVGVARGPDVLRRALVELAGCALAWAVRLTSGGRDEALRKALVAKSVAEQPALEDAA